MKKKLLSLALVAVIVLSAFSFASCGTDAYSLVTDALEKTESLDSYEADLTINMKMKIGATEMTVPTTVNVKAAGLGGDSPVALATTSLEVLTEKMEIVTYAEGGWIYVSMDGEGVKVKADTAEAKEYDYAGEIGNMLVSLPEDLLKELEITDGKDGASTVAIALSVEQFTSLFSEYAGGIVESVNESESDAVNVTFGDPKVEITVDGNGYIASYKIAFTMATEIMGQSVEYAIESTVTFKNPGTPVTVTAPAGYDKFEEIGDLLG